MKNIQFSNIKALAKKSHDSNKKFFQKLKKKVPGNLDSIVHKLHEQVFEEIDCLQCANCCKTLGPRITDKDIARLARFLKMKPSEFSEKYLYIDYIDEDKDYIFKALQCPFLLENNFCSVYEERPKACKEYPHTDHKKFHQLLGLTLKNTYTCPAVYLIIEKLKSSKL